MSLENGYSHSSKVKNLQPYLPDGEQRGGIQVLKGLNSTSNGHPKDADPAGLTVAQIDQEANKMGRLTDFLVDLTTPNGSSDSDHSSNRDSIDSFEHPVLAREHTKVKDRGVVLRTIQKEGKKVQNLFDDREVTFPNPNGELPAKTLGKLGEHGLRFMPVPAFPIDSRKELEEIVNGRKGHSPITEVFPMSYLEGVLNGEIPHPHRRGYYEAIDSDESETELTEALGIGNIHKASLEETRAKIAQNEAKALRSLNIDPKQAYIRVVTAKEELLKVALDGEEESRATHTHLRGNWRQHLAFDGREMKTVDMTDVGVSPQLVVVFSERPKQGDSFMKPNHR